MPLRPAELEASPSRDRAVALPPRRRITRSIPERQSRLIGVAPHVDLSRPACGANVYQARRTGGIRWPLWTNSTSGSPGRTGRMSVPHRLPVRLDHARAGAGTVHPARSQSHWTCIPAQRGMPMTHRCGVATERNGRSAPPVALAYRIAGSGGIGPSNAGRRRSLPNSCPGTPFS